MVVILDGDKKYLFKDKLLGKDMLEMDEVENLMFYDKDGNVITNLTASQKKLQRKAQQLSQYQMIAMMSIEPVLTLNDILNMDAILIGKITNALFIQKKS